MTLPDTPLGTRHASLSTCTPLPRVCALEVQLSRLTIVGGVRERSVVTRRGRGKTVCARGAYWALLCSPSTSPLEVAVETLSFAPWMSARAKRLRIYRLLANSFWFFLAMILLDRKSTRLNSSHQI